MRSCFHRQQSTGAGGVVPQRKFLGAEPTHVLVLKNTFTDVGYLVLPVKSAT